MKAGVAFKRADGHRPSAPSATRCRAGEVRGRLPLTPSDKRIHPSAVHRWTTGGLGDVRPEYLRVGRRRRTSFEGVSETSVPGAVSKRRAENAPARRAQQEQAGRTLPELLGGKAARGQGRRS